MNTPTLTAKLSGLTSALLFSTIFTASVQAGPGLEYWQARAQNAAVVGPVDKPPVPEFQCPGSVVVPITTMKAAQANGRGALVEVQLGTKRVCRVCPVTTVTVTNAWHNHRGPLSRVETVTVGAEHTCASDCGPSEKA